MDKCMVWGLLCAITGALLMVPVAINQNYNNATFIVFSTGMSILTVVFGLSCCHACRGLNLLAAGILASAATFFGVVAMLIYNVKDVGHNITFICGLGWTSVLVTSLSAILYMNAYKRIKTCPR